MSTRFDAASDRISFSGTMFAVGSGFTMTAWAYVVVDTDANQTFARLHASSGGSTIVTWATGSDGLTGPNYFTGGGSVTNATNMAVGAWRKIAISCSGTTGKSYVNTVGGTTEVDSGTVSVGTPDGLTLGGRAPADSSEWFNGRLAYVRVWTAELTQTEIETEWASATPVRTSGLWASWPLTDSTDLTDHSGSGRNLTAGSTAVSTEADPPLASNVTGTATAAFGALTATASGVPKVVASATASFGALSAAASGTPTVLGSATAQFGALSATASGTPKVLGTAALAGGSLAGAAAGVRTVIASATGQFGGLTGTAVSPSHVTGSAAATFGGLVGTAHGRGPAAQEQGSWWGLVDILREGAQLAREESTRDPEACPDCGEPLRAGPNSELYCPFDGSIWAAGGRLVGHVSAGRR
ncbi:LamG-like jellyroll fold domain-containing protein [Streptomyces sp. NPDC057257]|uniref:LamG-like jellyroll fold domain-containing protein n=1 Tax=Streptomyces sp. NPDC057257 TaxID=3346071 RepID=UPI00362CAF45